MSGGPIMAKRVVAGDYVMFDDRWRQVMYVRSLDDGTVRIALNSGDLMLRQPEDWVEVDAP